ncbi:MAG: hypothetical protein Q9190_001449 [Brigantiaea leucoxantha]
MKQPAEIRGSGGDRSSPKDRFELLLHDLQQELGPHAGLTSSPDRLQQIMREYISDEKGWDEYAFRDDAMTFTRNLVDRGNGSYNLLILKWTPGRESPIHDHVDSHCIMKILQGSLIETRYRFPNGKKPAPMEVTQKTTMELDSVTYMSDELGLHKIANLDPNNYAVSMHLYTPPNAAIEGCTIFNEETGESRHITEYKYYSEFGKKV